MDEEGKKHYYVKLFLAGLDTTQVVITLLDILTDAFFEEDFLTNDMIITELPGTETTSNNITKIINPHAIAVTSSNTINLYVLSTGSSSSGNPGVTHPHLYPGPTSAWSQLDVGTNLYAWKYSGQ
jgi:hypothetical protein